jgi:hypothetical protein
MAALRRKTKLPGRSTSQSFAETPFGSVARQVGLDVRRYDGGSERSAGWLKKPGSQLPSIA